MEIFNLKKTSKYLFLCGIIFLGNACKELDKIDYIQFKANFSMPNFAREQDNIVFQPSEDSGVKSDNTTRSGTINAQEFSWDFGNNNFSQEKMPTYAYQKLGIYNVKLKTKIQKQQGLVIDSITKSITILPKLNTPNTTFSFGGANRDETIYEILPIIDDSGYWLIGRRGINNIWIHKVDNDFNAIGTFPKTIDAFTNALIIPRGIETTADGGLVIAGEIQNTPQERDAFIIKLDPNGREDWSETIASLKDEYYVGVFEDKQGNFTAVGTSYSGSNNDINVTLDIFDENGDKINSVFSVNSNCKCKAESIYKLPDSGGIENAFVVAGTTRNRVPVILYVANNGLFNGFSLLANNDSDNFKGEGLTVLGLSDGKYALAGYLDNTTDATRKDAFIAKFNAINGSVPTWRSRFKMYSDEFRTLMEDANKNIIAIGNHYNQLSENDVFLAKFDNNTGANLQYKTFGTQNDECIYQAIYTLQNNILLVGTKKSTETIPFRDRGWLFKLNENWE